MKRTCEECGRPTVNKSKLCRFCVALNKQRANGTYKPRQQRRVRRVILAEGSHWFFNKWVIANRLPPLGVVGANGYNLVGVLNASNKELVKFKGPLPQSQHCKLVLEFPLTRRMRSL